MAIFAVIEQPDPNTSKLAPFIGQEFGQDFYALGNGAWLISYAGTTMELSAKLKLGEGGNGSALVLAVSNYFGFANRNIWEWLAQRLALPPPVPSSNG